MQTEKERGPKRDSAPERGNVGGNGKRHGLRTWKKQAETPIERLVERVREHLHINDPNLLFAVMGGMAANLIDGPPVWMMLVGASGSGKSTMLDMLKGLPGVEAADSIDTEAAFLSGTPKKDVRKGATGGLLNAIGSHGALVMKDFTGVLSLPNEKIKKILDVLRQVYDGSWDRPIGSEGGRTLKWVGRAAMFSGVTDVIDQYHQVAATLGERWLYYRLDGVDGFAQLKRGLENASKPGWKDELRGHVTAFFEDLDLRFGESRPHRGLEPKEILRISRIAKVGARCRSGVVWNQFRPQEMVTLTQAEAEGRIGEELGQLYVGMEWIGVEEKARWQVLEKMALDSMPRMRRQVLDQVIQANGHGLLFGDIVKNLVVKEAESASRPAIDRAVVELAVHKVLRKQGNGANTSVAMTDWMAGEYKAAFKNGGA